MWLFLKYLIVFNWSISGFVPHKKVKGVVFIYPNSHSNSVCQSYFIKWFQNYCSPSFQVSRIKHVHPFFKPGVFFSIACTVYNNKLQYHLCVAMCISLIFIYNNVWPNYWSISIQILFYLDSFFMQALSQI